MTPLLELRGVRRSYGSVVAVDHLDLTVPRGCIYGFLGPNGAGKTTAIRMIMNIYIPDEGTITLDGRPIDRKATDRIGYLPEERGLYRKMRVQEHIVYLARLKGMNRASATQRSATWLERMGLLDRARAKVDELSKGMQQKFQFISTVINEPELVILDEPFSGLDPLNVKLLREIILEIRASGRTVLFSTHVMEQAEQLCDYIFLINRGHKVLDGHLETIQDAFPVDTIRVAGDLTAPQIRNLSGVRDATDQGNEIHVHLEEGRDPQQLLQQLVALGRVTRYAAAKPPLSDIFIRAVEDSGATIAAGEVADVDSVVGRHE